jgi:predicted nucleic acid-binding protein
MLYIDTSIVVAYYCPESMSDAVEEILLDAENPAISYLTEVELMAALSRKIREGNLSFSDANRIISQFQTHVDKNAFTMLPVARKHYQTARRWIAQFTTPLRSLDALHLSVASASKRVLFTADARLKASAERLGVDVLNLP